MDQNNNPAVSPDELKAEQEALQEARADEVKAQVMQDYGFDPDIDGERIERLVDERMAAHQQKVSLTKQKVKWRTEAQKTPATPPAPATETKHLPAEEIAKIFDERLEQRDLSSLDYSDELKSEIQRIAKITGKSVKETARDPYIVNKIEDWEKERNAEAATITRTNRSGGKKSFSINSPPDTDY